MGQELRLSLASLPFDFCGLNRALAARARGANKVLHCTIPATGAKFRIIKSEPLSLLTWVLPGLYKRSLVHKLFSGSSEQTQLLMSANPDFSQT